MLETSLPVVMRGPVKVHVLRLTKFIAQVHDCYNTVLKRKFKQHFKFPEGLKLKFHQG